MRIPSSVDGRPLMSRHSDRLPEDLEAEPLPGTDAELDPVIDHDEFWELGHGDELGDDDLVEDFGQFDEDLPPDVEWDW
jgi:hypothetical protein